MKNKDNLPAAAGSHQPCEEKPLRSVLEIEHAVEILLKSVQGAQASGNEDAAKASAMGVMALAWVIGWESVGGNFQEMIDHCDDLEKRQEKRHTHGPRSQGERLRPAAGKESDGVSEGGEVDGRP